MILVPKRLKLSLNGDVKEKWSSIEGIYILDSSYVNGKPYWLQENGPYAIWFDKDGWNLHHESYLGQSLATLRSRITQTNLPHDVTWEHCLNDEWTPSDDISIDNIDGGEELYDVEAFGCASKCLVRCKKLFNLFQYSAEKTLFFTILQCNILIIQIYFRFYQSSLQCSFGSRKEA